MRGHASKLDAEQLAWQHKERTHEERNQARGPDVGTGNHVCRVSRSDASGSGWRPDTYLQSEDRMRATRLVTL
jgi:hypothetical protein